MNFQVNEPCQDQKRPDYVIVWWNMKVISSKNEIKLNKNIPDFPKSENGLIQMVRLGKYIRHKRVKKVEGFYCLCAVYRAADLRLCFCIF